MRIVQRSVFQIELPLYVSGNLFIKRTFLRDVGADGGITAKLILDKYGATVRTAFNELTTGLSSGFLKKQH
jgi:hypothetical protein